MNGLILTGDEWILSDTHFHHTSDWVLENRPSRWLEYVVDGWQRLVAPTDVVIHLGDLELGTAGEMDALVPSLPGMKFLIRGNHDNRSTTRYRKWGFVEIQAGRFYVQPGIGRRSEPSYVVLSHYPDDFCVDGEGIDVYIHGHQHKKADRSITHSDFDYKDNVSRWNANVEFNRYLPQKLSSIIKTVIK